MLCQTQEDFYHIDADNMLPRLLILDDLFGRNIPDGRNTDRENLCAHFLWQDATGDAAAKASNQKILQPTAEAIFCRAQSPACSAPGDTVENDLDTALESVRRGWPVGNVEFRTKNAERKRKRAGKAPSNSALITRQSTLASWSMVLIDLCFYTGRVTEESHRRTPGMPEGRPGDDDPRSYFGLTLLDAIHREFPELPVFILSSKPREEVSLEFNRRGALGFIDRSALDGPDLLEQALWHHGLLADAAGEIAGQSLPLLLALREARRAAGHREPVLIRGERGTGKELLARYIHGTGERRMQNAECRMRDGRDGTSPVADASRFVTVGCGGIDRNLHAQELFGIQPRTSGGVDGKVGLIEMAKGGDLFLDEVADLPPEVQASLLGVLEDRHLIRVGGRERLPVDVRFLSSSNEDLEAGEVPFRADLLDRLRRGGTIWLPPLRERKEDIPLLAAKFLGEAESRSLAIRPRRITPEAMELLLDHEWEGNVRELRSVIFDAVARHPDNDYLVPGHLRFPSVPKGEGEGGSRPGGAAERKHGESRSAQEVVDWLDRWRPDASDRAAWAGALPELRKASLRAAARLLAAAVAVTKRPTVERPEGIVQIHPAAKLATGDPDLTASKAADHFKRLLGPLEEELEGDLLEAYRISLRLRPKSPRRAEHLVG